MQAADICTADHPVHFRLSRTNLIQASTADVVPKHNRQMLFVVNVIMVQVEEHLGSSGGGDPGANNTLNMGKPGKKLRVLCMHMHARQSVAGELATLLEELRRVHGTSGSRGRRKRWREQGRRYPRGHIDMVMFCATSRAGSALG